MHRTSEQWRRKFSNIGMLWTHSGEPRKPHALLTSGMHSDGFVNSDVLLGDPYLLGEAADDLLELMVSEGVKLDNVERVVGPAMGAIVMAFAMAGAVNRFHAKSRSGKRCFSSYVEKVLDGRSRRFEFKRAYINPTELVLVVEDVLTTGGSISLTAAAVAASCGYLVNTCCVLVNRSQMVKVNNLNVVSLVHIPMNSWEPEHCSLCKKGSKAIHPKDRANWQKLIMQ